MDMNYFVSSITDAYDSLLKKYSKEESLKIIELAIQRSSADGIYDALIGIGDAINESSVKDEFHELITCMCSYESDGHIATYPTIIIHKEEN